MKIRYLNREEIDNLKWDSCIHYALNGNIYGYTWYLDNSCEYWGGLVEGDYESVFPLIWNKKFFGLPQLYQPYFCQQLGVYSVNFLSKGRLKQFYDAIPERFRYINIQINESNMLGENWGFNVMERSNYLLPLNKSYEELHAGYSTNLKRSLKKVPREELHVTQSIKPEALVDLYRKYQGPKISAANEAVFHMAHRIIYNALHRGLGFLSGIENKNGELITGGFFLSSHSRIVNLIPATSPEGREVNGMHYLLDIIIMSNAGRPVVLDFEGSSVPSIARFFKSFGSEDYPYFQIIRNNLPFYLKWIKPS
ncbi:MAG: hypothetical protein AAF502_00550 [Bacteroidota bacterium]